MDEIGNNASDPSLPFVPEGHSGETLPQPTWQDLMEADNQERLQRASIAIQATLRAERCELVGVPVILPDGRITANVQLVISNGAPPR